MKVRSYYEETVGLETVESRSSKTSSAPVAKLGYAISIRLGSREWPCVYCYRVTTGACRRIGHINKHKSWRNTSRKNDRFDENECRNEPRLTITPDTRDSVDEKSSLCREREKKKKRENKLPAEQTKSDDRHENFKDGISIATRREYKV